MTTKARSGPFFASQTSRPSLPLLSQRSPPSAADRTDSVASVPTTRSAGIDTINLTTINARWLKALHQYHSFRLHSSCSTFKRLLRDLHSNTDEQARTSLTDSGSSSNTTSPWALPTDQIALLFTNIALIHAFLGSYHLASQAFGEAVELDERLVVAWYGLGIAFFFLKEFGKSKRAFRRCFACFVAEEEGGQKYLKDDLTFNTWTLPDDGDSQQKDNDSLAREIAQHLQDIFHQNFPTGEWKLERARVDWNWRIAVFERNWQKSGITRPGGGKWGLNGLPVGVMFGPGPQSVRSITSYETTLGASKDFDRKSMESSKSASSGSIIVKAGNKVSRKLNFLQRTLTGIKSHKTTATNEPNKEGKPISNPIAIHSQENEHPSFQAIAIPEYHNGNHLEVNADEMPALASMPQTPYDVPEPYDYYDSEEEGEEVDKIKDNYDHPEAHDQTTIYPPRISSLISSPIVRSPHPLGHGRQSSTSSTASSYKPDVPTIKEVSEEQLPSLPPLEAQNWMGGPNISMIVTNNATGDIFLPNLMEDLLSPSPEVDSRLESNQENTMYYQTAEISTSNSQTHFSSSLQASRPTYSHHSTSTYRTSEISSLSSGPRFFPSLSSHREETDSFIDTFRQSIPDRNVIQGRPTSYASTISGLLEYYSPRSPRNQSDFDPPINTGEGIPSLTLNSTDNHPDSPALASSPLVYPSPLRPRHTSIKRLSDAAESSHMSESSRRNVMADEIRLPTPEPVWGRSRVSITGRTCLGEWEWEDKYERWMRGEADADPWSEGEEDEGTFMLKPVAFEGFGKGKANSKDL